MGQSVAVGAIHCLLPNAAEDVESLSEVTIIVRDQKRFAGKCTKHCLRIPDCIYVVRTYLTSKKTDNLLKTHNARAIEIRSWI